MDLIVPRCQTDRATNQAGELRTRRLWSLHTVQIGDSRDNM
jgi:hypothetical protein